MAPTETFDPVAFKEAQRADWQAAAPGWRRWCDVLEAEMAGQAVSLRLVELAALGPGDTVLDVAAGYGEPALTAAHAVGNSGRVVATDIAADMLAFGRERAVEAGLDNVDFLEEDAERLRFDGETFDAILSRHGLQFLPDVRSVLARLHSFLKRDGRLGAAVWGPPDTVQFARSIPVILEELELPPPPAGRPGPFALADANALARLVAEAGFRDVETGTVTAVYETTSPEDFTQWTRDVAPPIANLVNGQSPEVQEQIWRKVTEAWAPLVSPDGRVRAESEAIWVAATK
jgi:ubiquinone/menaquinone biosynthesis C-methylase UbiE